MESLHLVSLVCVFAKAIYSKACEIKWKEPAKFKSCLLMMGMFHLIIVFMSILNKLFGSAGMRDALVQSSIVGEGSVDSALRGKSYNRGIRLYKIFYEALNRIIIAELDPGTNLQEDFEAAILFHILQRTISQYTNSNLRLETIIN